MGLHKILDRYQFMNKYFHGKLVKTPEGAKKLGDEIHRQILYMIRNNMQFPDSVYPQTVYFAKTLNAMGWKPIGGEVHLSDPHLEYTTGIDVVAWDAKYNCEIIIEVKTTGATWNEASQELENMSLGHHDLPKTSPWSEIPEFKVDSPVSRALAQVTLEYLRLAEERPAKRKAVVVYLFNVPPMDITQLKNENYENYVRQFYPPEIVLSPLFYNKLITLAKPVVSS